MSNRIRRTKPAPASFVSKVVHGGELTYWNGTPCPAVRVRLRLEGDGGHSGYWARELIGTVRAAVRVQYGGEVFYLDDEDGSGWRKVTDGRGLPRSSHRSLYGREVVPS